VRWRGAFNLPIPIRESPGEQIGIFPIDVRSTANLSFSNTEELWKGVSSMNSIRLFLNKYTLGVSAALLAVAFAPAPVQAGDWGISLNLPFFRVRASDGYYYYDNDYRHPYRYRSHNYRPHNRYYYHPRRWDLGTEEDVRYNPDGSIEHETTRRYIGPDGRTYEDTVDRHTHY
jgi:hypothetical protein